MPLAYSWFPTMQQKLPVLPAATWTGRLEAMVQDRVVWARMACPAGNQARFSSVAAMVWMLLPAWTCFTFHFCLSPGPAHARCPLGT